MHAAFGQFTAAELYCPQCKRAQPVRERLLLVLPTGKLHELVCARCASSLGKRTVASGPGSLATPRSGRGSDPG